MWCIIAQVIDHCEKKLFDNDMYEQTGIWKYVDKYPSSAFSTCMCIGVEYTGSVVSACRCVGVESAGVWEYNILVLSSVPAGVLE